MEKCLVFLVKFVIEQPLYSSYGKPRVDYEVAIPLTRRLAEIRSDTTEPPSVLLDKAIVIPSGDEDAYVLYETAVVMPELHVCSICGGGLGLGRCTGCGVRFIEGDDRCSNTIPIPPKMVAFLYKEHGFIFRIHPAVWWEIEKLNWEQLPYLT